jgi:hypothetical protein
VLCFSLLFSFLFFELFIREDTDEDNDILCLVAFLNYAGDRRGKGYSVVTSTSKTFINPLIIHRNYGQGGLRYRSARLIYRITIVIIRFRSLRPSRDVTTFLWSLDLIYSFEHNLCGKRYKSCLRERVFNYRPFYYINRDLVVRV